MKPTASDRDPGPRPKREEPDLRRRYWFGRTLRRIGDDSGPPKLKHGNRPCARPHPFPMTTRPAVPIPCEARSPRANPHMALIEQAREVAANVPGRAAELRLPGTATRYVSETRQPSWNVDGRRFRRSGLRRTPGELSKSADQRKAHQETAGGFRRLVNRRIRHHPGESLLAADRRRFQVRAGRHHPASRRFRVRLQSAAGASQLEDLGARTVRRARL